MISHRRRSRKSFSRRQSSAVSIRSQPDWLILGLTLVLVSIGLIMVLDASIIEALTQFGDKYHFVKLQARSLGIGFIALLLTTLTPLSWIKQLSRYIILFSLLLLVLVLIPGVTNEFQGARRWLVIGGFVIQPSEITKLAAIVYFPSWLTRHQRFGPFAALVALITFLLLLEPDLGTSLIIFSIAFCLYFVSGASLKYIYTTIIASVTGFIGLILVSPYRFDRFKTFLNPTDDPLGTAYHIRQIVISLGSGGLLGTGFGRSRQKFQFLPEATTDSIFAVIGEETGFIGATFVIILFMALVFRIFKLVPRVENDYAKLILAGVACWLGIQTILNLAAMVALVPLTGVPLPLISYGGSSLITMLAGIGLALNASRERS